MPQFILNTNNDPFPSHLIDDFAFGYIEAMFFTNGDSGDEDENSLNDLGLEALTKESVLSIAEDCKDFRKLARYLLEEASERGYSDRQAGADFWFTRQHHGVGFWDRNELQENKLGDKLSDIAHSFAECFVYIGDDGNIHY